MDWMQIRGAKLASIVDVLGAMSNPNSLELVQWGELLKHTTMLAGKLVLNHRFQAGSFKRASLQ